MEQGALGRAEPIAKPPPTTTIGSGARSGFLGTGFRPLIQKCRRRRRFSGELVHQADALLILDHLGCSPRPTPSLLGAFWRIPQIAGRIDFGAKMWKFLPLTQLGTDAADQCQAIIEASRPDVLIPEGGIQPDELLHQPDAFFVLDHLDGNAPRAEEFLIAYESPVLADHYTGNSIQ